MSENDVTTQEQAVDDRDAIASPWPYRPSRLSDLLAVDDVAGLLAQGIISKLGCLVTVFEPGQDAKKPRRIDPSGQPDAPRSCPVTHFLRYGKVNGKPAFDGADDEFRRHEARLAARVLDARNEPDGEGLFAARAPLGLWDFACRIVVRGVPLAAVIAGGRVRSEEDRPKIVKRIGKLGKLTQGEIRSLEAAGAPVVAPIRPHDESVRKQLLEEVERIPRVDNALTDGLPRFAEFLGRLAAGRLALSRLGWEEGVLNRLLPADAPLPTRRGGVWGWLQRCVRGLHEALGVEFVVAFGRPPEELGGEIGALRLLGQSGLPTSQKVDLRGARPALELDATRFGAGGVDPSERVENALAEVSTLIGALRTTSDTPPGWKDVLTKSLFVAILDESPGSEVAFAFGPAHGGIEPQREDLAFLWRCTRRISERYLLCASESSRRFSSGRLEQFEERERLRQVRKKSPLRPQRFDARRLLDRCLESAGDRAAQSGVTFDLKGLPERSMLEADRTKLGAALDAVIDCAIGNAVAAADGSRPSILVSLRRAKKVRDQIEFVFDVVGRFLSGSERRELFHDDTPHDDEPEAASTDATAAGDADAPTTTTNDDDGRDPGGEHEAHEQDAAERDDAARAGKRSGPISLRTAQRYVSFHRGRLQIDSSRTGGDSAAGEPLGRTLFAIRIPDSVTLEPLPRGPRRHPDGGARRGGGGGRGRGRGRPR